MIGVYLFDLDGTLIDTKIYAEAFPKINLRVKEELDLSDAELEQKAIGFGLKRNKLGMFDTGDLCKELGLLDIYYEEIETVLSGMNVLHEPVEGVLKCLKEKGARIGVVSNSMKRTIQVHVKAHHLSELVEFIFSSEDAGFRKDNVRFWEKLIEVEKLDPSSCLVVGDDIVEDVEVPSKLGFNVFHLKNVDELKKLM